MAPYDISFHPKDLITNAVFSPENGYLTEDDQKKLGKIDNRASKKCELLCRACGWNSNTEFGSYLPRLRIYHTRANSGLWIMGNDWFIRDRLAKPGIRTNDYMTYKFLREQGTKDIPLVEEMYQFGKEGDEFQFTVMSRVKGVPLENIWSQLTPEEKRGYADQMIAALRELRQFTAPAPQRVDGSPLWDNFIGMCNTETICKVVPKTKEEWLDGMDKELRAGIAKELGTDDEASIEALVQELRTNFPESAPFVLTHGDLDLANIMVHEGKILAIIDWESAGYYPWWVERWASFQNQPSMNGHELFDMVWSALEPELPRLEFVAKAAHLANTVSDYFRRAPITHKHSHDVWLRPKWCECKPFAGVCRGVDWDGWENDLEHSVEPNVEQKSFDRSLEPYRFS
jgi:hypothetical protein